MHKNIRNAIIPLLLFGWTLVAIGIYQHEAGNQAEPIPTSASQAPSGLTSPTSSDSSTNEVPANSTPPGVETQVTAPKPSPASGPATFSYTVQPGDNLWDIAATYHTSVDHLLALNNLSSDALCLGQTLLVSGSADKPLQTAQPPTSAPTPSRSGDTRAGTVLQYAAKFLNAPYKYGGTTPAGFDCSGFTQYVYKHVGVSLPRTAAAQASIGTRVEKAKLLPGDLVFFATAGGGINHVGIYAGNGRFIHSSSPTSGGVIYTSLQESYYVKSYAGARRVSN